MSGHLFPLPHLTDPLHIARFWSKVDVGRPGVCWPWRAATNEHGYGVFRLPEVHTLVKAHRVAWSLANGRVADAPCLLHSCDNPPCCNPAHLTPGTVADNNADMAAKGRSRGIQHSRLTQSQVEEIKARCAAGEPQASIAADLSVAQSYVSMVNAGKRLSRKEIA